MMLFPVGYFWYFFDLNIEKWCKSHFFSVDQMLCSQTSSQNLQCKLTHWTSLKAAFMY